MFKVGENIGRYALLRRLAGGGMGEVFLAAQKGAAGVGPPVALKVLRQELASDATFVQMMIDEAKISMFLNHQNIVSVLDFAEDDGAYYIAMEFVQGATVEKLIEALKHANKKLDVSVGLFIGIEICRALKYAHACTNHLGEPLNIVHRDVTPANVLLSIQGEVKLTDFGIARAKGRIHQTQAGVVKGKFGYLAPEIARYEMIDARADLFALGVVLFQLLAGQHPVAGASVMEAIFRFEEKQLPRPSQFNPAIPEAVEAIIMRALEPRPDDRWSSAQELQVALQEAAMNDPACRRGLPNAAVALSGVLKELVPESFEDPVPPELPRDPTLPPGYAILNTKVFNSGQDPVPAPRMPSAAMKKKPLPGIPANASFVELVPGARSLPQTTSSMRAKGGTFGESTTHDMPQLPDPGSLSGPGLIESNAIDPPVTTFDEPTATGNDSFGAETSQDIPRLPDPELSTDSSEFGGATQVERAHQEPLTTSRGAAIPQVTDLGFGDATITGAQFGGQFGGQTITNSDFGTATQADNTFRGLHAPTEAQIFEPESFDIPAPVSARDTVEVFDGAGFGDKTLADPSFRALVPPTDTLQDDSDDATSASVRSHSSDLAFEPTSIRNEVESPFQPTPTYKSPIPVVPRAKSEVPRVTVPKVTVPKVTVPKITVPPKPTKPTMPAIIVPPIVTTVDLDREEQAIYGAATENNEDAFGGNTDKWVAGKIDGKQLSWSDDDAARRAVETRNAVKGIANSSPAPPVVATRPSAVAMRATSRIAQPAYPTAPAQPNYPAPVPQPPPTLSQPPPVLNFAPGFETPVAAPVRSKKGPVIAAFVALAVGIGTLAGALIYPALFAPALSITTTPPGAVVTINGRRAPGVTPLELEVEPKVEQHIEIALEGHQSVQRDITEIERGQTYAINVTLEGLAPEIRIVPGGRLFINGREVGSGASVRATGIDLHAPVELRVETEGFEPFKATFERGSQIPAVVDVVLKRQ